MNAGRRLMIDLCLAIISQAEEAGAMDEDTYVALGEAAKLMQKEEYWSLRNMSKHADKNDSTALQVAISEVALPLLEEAVKAWEDEDIHLMSELMEAAAKAEPAPKKKSKKDLAKSKK